MKKKHLYPLLLALSLTVVAQDYNLIIHTKSGETITVPTNDIEQMDFEEIQQPGGQLSTPQLSSEQLSDNSFKMSWTAVKDADGYYWNLDGATFSYTDDTSYTLTNLAEGTHTFSVKAVAAKDSGYTDSEYSTVTMRVAGKNDTHAMRFLIANYTHNYARIYFLPGTSPSYKVAVLPASSATSDQAVINLVNSMSAGEVSDISAKEEHRYTGLNPETDYVVAAIPSDMPDVVYTRAFKTEATPVSGSKGTIFPAGVSASAGFIDVDKVGDNEYGNDSPLCWACVAAGMTQWWINDYKSGTGTEYPFTYPLPSESLFYSTPVMDVISQAYYHQAGDVRNTLSWFFAGVQHPENYYVNNVCAFNLNYQYVKGGFMGMSEQQFSEYYDYNSIIDLFSGKSASEMKVIFADEMLGWLRHGPVYFCISGNHALCAWGADYTVQPDGSKLITKLYVAENDLVGGNVLNALQDATVYYTDFNSGKTEYPYITLPSIYDGGTRDSGRLGVFCAIRSWNSINGK